MTMHVSVTQSFVLLCTHQTVCRKTELNHNPQCFALKVSNSTSVIFWGSVGPKNVGNCASCDRRNNAEKHVETLQDNFFQGTKAMLGMKVSHSSSNMSMQPLTDQYLPTFTSVSVRSVPLHGQRRSPSLVVIKNVILRMKIQINADA